MGSSSKISLKLLIDNKAKKVLFAEAGKEFVDFVFSLLTLPIGAVAKLVSAGTMHGSVGRLYESVDRMGSVRIFYMNRSPEGNISDKDQEKFQEANDIFVGAVVVAELFGEQVVNAFCGSSVVRLTACKVAWSSDGSLGELGSSAAWNMRICWSCRRCRA